MNIYIIHHDDYRTGRILTVFDKEGLKNKYEDEDDDRDEDDFISVDELNNKIEEDENLLDNVLLNNTFNDTYSVYLISGEGYHGSEDAHIIHILNKENKNDADNILLHLFSDINGHQPFVQTGYVGFYKPDGYFPEALPKYFVAHHPLIDEQINILLNKSLFYCIAVVIYNDKLINYIHIAP